MTPAHPSSVPTPPPPPAAPSDYCFLMRNRSGHCVRSKHVQFIQVVRRGCVVMVDGKPLRSNRPVADLLADLGRAGFVQAHRSYHVALRHVKQRQPAQLVLVVGSHQLPIGRAYKKALLDRITSRG